MDLGQLLVSLGVDSSALTAGIQTALASLSAFVDRAATAGAQAGRNVADGFKQGNATLEQHFQQLDKLTGGYERLGGAIQSAGATLSTYLTLPILGVGAASIQTAGDIEALEKGFAATYKGSEDLGTALAKVKELAKLPGLGLEEAIQGATNLQAAGLSADLATRSLQAVGNALATVGKGKADLQGVTDVFSKMSASGKVTERDILELSRRIPQLRQAMQEAFNVGDAAGIKKLGLDTTTFIEGITAQLAKLPAVTGGIKNSLENFGDDVKTSLDTVGETLAKNLNVEGLLGTLGSFLKGLANDFASLSPGTQKLVIGLAGAAAAIGPLLVAFGGVVALLPSLTAGFATLGVTSLSALAPILPIAAAVAAAAVLIYTNWDSIVAYFRGPAGDTFRDLGASVVEAFSAIRNAVSALVSGPIGQLVGAFVKMELAIGGKGLQVAVGLLSAAFSLLATDLRIATDVLSGNFAGALDDANSGLGRILGTLRNLLGLTSRTGKSLSEFFKTEGKQVEIDPSVEGAASGRGSGAIPDTSASVETLEKLKQQLQALRDEYEKTETSSTRFYQLQGKIAQLDAYIKKLEAAAKATNDIAKAYQEAQDKLKGTDFRVGAGVESPYDGAVEKVKTLQQAIEKVASTPGGIGSPQLAKLVSQLDTAQGKLTALLKGLQLKPAAPSDAQAEADALGINADTIAKVKRELADADLKAKVAFEYDQDTGKLKAALAQNAENATKQLAAAGIQPGYDADTRDLAADAPRRKFDAANTEEVKQYRAALADADAQQRLFGNGFDGTNAKLNITAARMRSLYEQLARTADPSIYAALKAQLASTGEEFNKLLDKSKAEQLGKTLQDAYVGALENVVGLIGENIGKMIAGTESGQEAMQNVFKGLLGIFGQFLQQFGGALVAFGIAKAAAVNPNPAVAIAAGVAAIALGSLLSGLASSGPSLSSGAGSFGSSGGSAAGGVNSAYQATRNSTLNVQVTFAPIKNVLQGSTLVQMIEVEKYRVLKNR